MNGECVTLTRSNDVAIVSVNFPPVNAISAPVRSGISGAIQSVLQDEGINAILLICQGRTFFAGADITELGRPLAEPTLRQLNQIIENASKPIIAAIHGTALGGGLELALAAHYRIAVPSAKCGLPEVRLGLLPGGGGTQRLPRLIGVGKALDLMLTGEPVSAIEAAEIGLINSLSDEDRLLECAVAFAGKVVAEGLPLRKVRDLDDKLVEARGDTDLIAKYRTDSAAAIAVLLHQNV
jgi:3-hydroxyacyl-CoA dehydrogenase